MKKFLFFLFSFLIGLGIFFGVVKWVGWQEIKESLSTFYGFKGLAILALTLLIWVITIWKWKFIFNSQGYNFSVLGLGEILFASFSITYLLAPTIIFGGEGFRLFTFRKKFHIPWEKTLTVSAIEKLLKGSVILLVLISGASVFFFLAKVPLPNFKLIAVAFIALLAVALTIFYFKSFRKESILKWFLNFFGAKNKKNGYLIQDIEKEIFHFFDFKRSLMWKGLAITFLRYFLIFARCWLVIFFLKGEISVFSALAILFFVYLSFLLPLPAGLGSSEVAQAFAFSALGWGAAAGITFSFILRGVDVLIALFGLVLLIKLGIRFFRDNVGNLISKFASK